MIVSTCLVVVLIGVLEVVRRRGARRRMLAKFPGDYPWPLIGNALQLGFDADEASHKLFKLWEKHGKSNFRLTVGSEEWVMLSEPDDVGTILGHPTELSKPPERNATMMPFFGNSLSTSEDNLMGIDKNLLETPDHPYLLASGRVIDIANKNYFSYWRNISFLFKWTPMYREMMNVIKVVREMSDMILHERRIKLNQIVNEIKANNKNINTDLEELINEKLSKDICLLDSLILSKLPNGESLPEEFINEEITLLCFTGHYTTTKSIAHTMYCLAKYPEIQRKVYEEQCSIFNNDLLKEPTNQDLNEMKYLEAVIKESIRVIPTVPKIGRHLQNDLKLKDGKVIPAGSTVIVHYEGLNNNDKVFPNPKKYDPERFLETNIHPYAFTPFSAGPRNCIGFRYAWVAMKATLSKILRTFEVAQGAVEHEPQFAYRIITESVNGLHLWLKKRRL